LEVKTPIWNETDLELEKLKEDSIFVYGKKIENKKPPYYRGSMPLKFKVGYPPGGTPGTTYSERPLFYNFGDFVNYFIYKGSIIVGSQTYKKDNLVAEARVTNFTTEEGLPIALIEEFHYEDGKAVYKCESTIDLRNGLKTDERKVAGKKINEYYFIWPI
ncbi:MAG: hypothetical protein ACOC5T_09380, partial [Elusimicrobiota bacterium]